MYRPFILWYFTSVVLAAIQDRETNGPLLQSRIPVVEHISENTTEPQLQGAWERELDELVEGCACKETQEMSCLCQGDTLDHLPTDLGPGVIRLSLVSLSIQVLRAGFFEAYSSTLRDLYLESMKKLTEIEPGAFNNLPHLRILYIKQASKLKSIPDGVFEVFLPNLKILRITQSALEVIPKMNHLQTMSIMSMIDLDSNRIRNVTTGSVKVKAEIVNLEYNRIESIQDRAFQDSQIAKLSLKGNKDLVWIGDHAFLGLQNLRKLDMSQTSIFRLPTLGLEGLEVLKLADTFSLKVFPSVYHFKYIKEAQLTYAYHCCAFRFPAAHDPQEYARFHALKADMERLHCANRHTTTTPFTPSETTSKPGGIESTPTKLSTLEKWNSSPTLWSFLVKPLSHWATNFETRNRRKRQEDPFGRVVYKPYPTDNGSQSWDTQLQNVLREKTGFGRMDEKNDEPSVQTFEGTFHVTTASLRTVPVTVYCGDFVKNYRDVQCSPVPDAFNPCEDVMGNAALRVAVWFVVVAAVLGNLSVMIVLMSSRFTMSVSKFLMCNLAFADLCMGLYLMVIAAFDLHTIGVYFNHAIDWQHEPELYRVLQKVTAKLKEVIEQGAGCKVAGFLTVFASELSIFTLTVITLERWYAITYAIHLNKRLKLGLAAKIMTCGWIYAVTMASLPLLGISGYTRTSICLPMENQDSTDLVFLLTLLSINGLAFLLICGCYGKMYVSIRRQQATATDINVAKRMAMLVFTDFACWAPIAFFGLTAVAGYPLINVTNSKILLVFFYPLNSCANPFLYAILTKQYRRDFFILISRYGFCSKRAMKYKGTYSTNTTNRVLSVKTNYRSSLFSQNGKGTRTNINPPPGDQDTTDSTVYEILRLGSDRRPSGQRRRRLSILCEQDRFSSDDERSSSPLHRGSPHPIKNSYTKLNIPCLEQEEILKRVLGESADTGIDSKTLDDDRLIISEASEISSAVQTNSSTTADTQI